MPFSEKLITIIVACEEGIQEKHQSFIEGLAAQVRETKEIALHIGADYGSSIVTGCLRRLNAEGTINLLVETKGHSMVRRLQHTLLINARTPYTLFLDPSVSVKEQALVTLEQFTLSHSPLLLSGLKTTDTFLDARCFMTNTTHLRKSNVLSSTVEHFSNQVLSERIQRLFKQESIDPYYWDESLATLFDIRT